MNDKRIQPRSCGTQYVRVQVACGSYISDRTNFESFPKLRAVNLKIGVQIRGPKADVVQPGQRLVNLKNETFQAGDLALSLTWPLRRLRNDARPSAPTRIQRQRWRRRSKPPGSWKRNKE